MANLLDSKLTPPMSVQEAVYIRGAINTYIRGLKASDEKDVLMMWLRSLERFLNDTSVWHDLDKAF